MYYDAGTRLYYHHGSWTFHRFDPLTSQFQLHSYAPAYATTIAAYQEAMRPKGWIAQSRVWHDKHVHFYHIFSWIFD